MSVLFHFLFHRNLHRLVLVAEVFLKLQEHLQEPLHRRVAVELQELKHRRIRTLAASSYRVTDLDEN